jgi:predicted  nucleic acid-binding Zn-ribbon protein
MVNEGTSLVWTGRRNVQHMFQIVTLGLLVTLAAAATVATVLSALGFFPWLQMQTVLSSGTIFDAGVWVQSLGSALLVGLCFFIPSANRMKDLERSHRDFGLTMNDIAQAYQLSHATDRKRNFSLSTEFDTMRERLTHMREHPELGHLEPEVLELAAQMSFTTRELAQIYSEDKVNRAKDFLKARQQELDSFNENLSLALTATQELKRWQSDVEASETETNRQMDRLEKDLQEILPQLGYEMDEAQSLPVTLEDTGFLSSDGTEDSKVVSLPASPTSISAK